VMDVVRASYCGTEGDGEMSKRPEDDYRSADELPVRGTEVMAALTGSLGVVGCQAWHSLSAVDMTLSASYFPASQRLGMNGNLDKYVPLRSC
jgi:hypothetical protein